MLILGTDEEAFSELKSNFEFPKDLGQLQHDYSEIEPLYREAQEYSGQSSQEDHQSKFFIQERVLYRQQGAETKMVVLQKVRDLMLHLSHSGPWAGHLGRQNTTARISRHLFWPNLRRDVVVFLGVVQNVCNGCSLQLLEDPLKLP